MADLAKQLAQLQQLLLERQRVIVVRLHPMPGGAERAPDEGVVLIGGTPESRAAIQAQLAKEGTLWRAQKRRARPPRRASLG